MCNTIKLDTNILIKNFKIDRFHFNKPAFLNKLLGNEDLFKELTAYSLIQTSEEIRGLKKALIADDIEKFKSYAHKLKGTASNMCFERIADLVALIEKTIENSSYSIKQIQTCIDSIESEWKQVKQEIINLYPDRY